MTLDRTDLIEMHIATRPDATPVAAHTLPPSTKTP